MFKCLFAAKNWTLHLISLIFLFMQHCLCLPLNTLFVTHFPTKAKQNTSGSCLLELILQSELELAYQKSLSRLEWGGLALKSGCFYRMWSTQRKFACRVEASNLLTYLPSYPYLLTYQHLLTYLPTHALCTKFVFYSHTYLLT